MARIIIIIIIIIVQRTMELVNYWTSVYVMAAVTGLVIIFEFITCARAVSFYVYILI